MKICTRFFDCGLWPHTNVQDPGLGFGKPGRHPDPIARRTTGFRNPWRDCA